MKSSIFMMFVRSSVGVILFRNLILIECRVRVESSKIITISKGGVHIETSKILISYKDAIISCNFLSYFIETKETFLVS